MNRRLAVAVAAVVALAAVLLYALVLRDRGGDRSAAAPRDAGAAARPAPGGETPPAPALPQVSVDDDPVGGETLEGQVIDEDEQPVGGAIVTLSSSPRRTATSEADGSFGFDQLVGKTYHLSARADDRIGGPVPHTVSDRSGPVVIRLRRGASVAVEVVSDGSFTPLPGAVVVLAAASEQLATADAAGKVRFRGAPTGWAQVTASAPGHAVGGQLLEIPDSPGVEVAVRLALRAGAPVTGVVVDAGGRPGAGAAVAAHDTAEVVHLADDRASARSDAQGRFTLDAVPAGTHRFVAHHRDFPPAATEPMATDGATTTSGVRVQFAAAATLSGAVVDGGGAPVPWAAVRVAPASGGGGLDGGGVRERLADGEGRFAIKGLARAPVKVVAIAEQASSQVIEVDLAGQPAELTLVVDVAGQIAGVVVDGAGEPVPDVQVSGWPDLMGGGGHDVALRGAASATTDGGGRFALRGLPEGEYLLGVGRVGAANPFSRKSTRARTGDRAVRLVLEADGALRGRVLYGDGSAPGLFTIAVGFPPGVPVASADGRFHIPAVAPGKHDVTVRGPEFAETVVADVAVAPGETADLGTITVKRGRSVRGVVTDAGGRPVSGAEVAAATQIIGDGKTLVAELGVAGGEMAGLRRARTGDDGSYVLRGIDEQRPLVLAADHPRAGRSAATVIAPGGDSPTIDLRLGPTGGVRGRVTSDGKPAAGLAVFATPAERPELVSLVTTGSDGRYQIDRLAPGRYQLTAMLGSGMTARTAGAEVTIAPGQVASADVAIDRGQVTLSVSVRGLGGATIDSAQVFLFRGAVDVKNGAELVAAFGKASAAGALQAFTRGTAPESFQGVMAGPHSICVIPITGDLMGDPQVAARVQKNVAILEVHCRPVEVAAAPLEQAVTLEVPPMKPLPG
jgi:hypothetical protein